MSSKNSKSGSFRLVESPEDLSRLESSLYKFYPESLQMMNIVIMKRLDKYPESVKVSLYLYDEDFEAPFLVSTQEPNFHSPYGVITWLPGTPTPAMMKAYDSLISWEQSPCFSNNQMSFAPHLKTLLDKRENTSKYAGGIPGALYAINRHLHVTLDTPEIPQHLQVSPLSPPLAPKIIDSWRYAEPHSSLAVSACLSPGSLPSCGIFLKSSGDLVSSALFSPLGTINILHTEESQRRQGLGGLTLQCLSESITSLHPLLTPAAEVEPWNSSSTSLVQKCGFTFVCDIIWYYYESPLGKVGQAASK